MTDKKEVRSDAIKLVTRELVSCKTLLIVESAIVETLTPLWKKFDAKEELSAEERGAVREYAESKSRTSQLPAQIAAWEYVLELLDSDGD